MPRYEFEIGGKVYEVDAERMPSGAQLRALAAKMGGASAARKPARPEDFMDPQPAAPEGSALGRFASGAWEMLNPVTAVTGLATAAANPWDTGKALIGAQLEQGGKAVDAFREGRYSEAAGHAGAAALPVLGPIAANIGEGIAENGDIAGGLGRATGIAAPILGARAAVSKANAVGAKTGAAVKALLDPGAATVDAVRWALKQGVPVDAATATGNRVVRGAKAAADSSLGGAVTGSKAAKMRAESMAKLGRKLAKDADPSGMATAETAGASVADAIEGVVRKSAGEQSDAYARAFEKADPVVDLASKRAALKPVLDRLMKKKELTGQLMGDEGRAAVALDALVNGPDAAPLSAVDAALGDVKAMARGAAMPELRTSGQGAAAAAVREIEDAVQAAAKDAGIWDDLRAGRDATIAKWTAAETLDKLKAEPVGTFRALTQSGDAAIDKLREVKALAPGEMPRIGRAYLEGLMDMATAEGGFGRESKLWAEWAKLGDETKKVIYPDAELRASLDRFFLVGKKMAENPNPSGSALVAQVPGQVALTFVNPAASAATVLTGSVLSKALNSPTVARLLTQAMETPATAPAAKSLRARLAVALKKYAPAAAPTVGQAVDRTRPAPASP